MSLQTGTELISIALLFNKATGVYGMLTLFTGYSLSALQVTAYLGSIFVLVTLALCLSHIRKQSPLENLVLAWVYAIDTVASAAYTTAFATSWYLATMHGGGSAAIAAGSPMDGDVAQEERRNEAQTQTTEQQPAAAGPDTAASMALIIAFTLIRVYFALVVLSYARRVVLRFADERMPEDVESGGDGGDTSADPFAVGAPLGEGWRGRLGRALVSVGRGFWLGGKKEDEEWARAVNSKLRGRSRE